MFSKSHFFTALKKKKKKRQHLQSTCYLQVQELNFTMKLQHNKINKQACMITFHVQYLSTEHVVAVYQILEKISIQGPYRVY